MVKIYTQSNCFHNIEYKIDQADSVFVSKLYEGALVSISGDQLVDMRDNTLVSSNIYTEDEISFFHQAVVNTLTRDNIERVEDGLYIAVGSVFNNNINQFDKPQLMSLYKDTHQVESLNEALEYMIYNHWYGVTLTITRGSLVKVYLLPALYFKMYENKKWIDNPIQDDQPKPEADYIGGGLFYVEGGSNKPI
jgi:hypothetical protein